MDTRAHTLAFCLFVFVSLCACACRVVMRFQRVDCYNRLHRAITAAAHRQTSTATLPPQPSFLIVFIFAQLLFHVFCWLAMCGMGMTSSAPNKPLPHRKGVFFGFTLLDPSNLSTSLSTRPCLTYVYLFVYVCHCFWLHLKGFPFHTHTRTHAHTHIHTYTLKCKSFLFFRLGFGSGIHFEM